MTAPLEVYAPGTNGYLPDAGYHEMWDFVRTLDDPLGFVAAQEAQPFMGNGSATNLVLPIGKYAMWADLYEKIHHSDRYAEQVRPLFQTTNRGIRVDPAMRPSLTSTLLRVMFEQLSIHGLAHLGGGHL